MEIGKLEGRDSKHIHTYIMPMQQTIIRGFAYITFYRFFLSSPQPHFCIVDQSYDKVYFPQAGLQSVYQHYTRKYRLSYLVLKIWLDIEINLDKL